MSNKVIDYMIIIGEDDGYDDEYQSLVEMVTEGIENGWQPYGSPFTHKSEKLCQTMVRYQDKDDSTQQA